MGRLSPVQKALLLWISKILETQVTYDPYRDGYPEGVRYKTLSSLWHRLLLQESKGQYTFTPKGIAVLAQLSN